MKLWSRVFGEAELFCQGQLGVMRITKKMFDETGTSSEDTDGLVNYVGRIKGVKAAILLREDTPNFTKISLRSTQDINVQAIAAELGGGGHINAAGCALGRPPPVCWAARGTNRWANAPNAARTSWTASWS